MRPASPSESPPASSGGGNGAAHVHMQTFVFNVDNLSSPGVAATAAPNGMPPLGFLPGAVSAVISTAIDLPELPGLADLLGGTATPANTAAREWRAPSCPPFSPEEVISTFEVVAPSSPRSTTASASVANTGEPHAAPEVKECAICLEPLFCQPSARDDAVAAASGVSHTPPPSAAPSPPLPAAAEAEAEAEAEAAPAVAAESHTVREVYCGHRFHERCIRHWIALGHYACPLCRSPFVYD
ncbi:Ring finger domain/Zinc finger, C3HC4 type (RING finger) containing protein [Novymonas esmeraldas]|uniref:Ring finger domain/Zinc finger, C3HC4 type (RING finger) containing protein n=1 Tax=Novymonas esmeraldas TaxID=1808958 RepID=A0AAW0ELC5_9TRYP